MPNAIPRRARAAARADSARGGRLIYAGPICFFLGIFTWVIGNMCVLARCNERYGRSPGYGLLSSRRVMKDYGRQDWKAVAWLGLVTLGFFVLAILFGFFSHGA